MASKWSTLKGQLPAKPDDDPDYGARVRAERDRLRVIEDGDNRERPAIMRDFVLAYNELDAEKKALAAREKEINLSMEALVGLIVEELNKPGASEIWRGEGFTFSEKPEPYPSVVDKEAMREHFVPLKAIADLLEELQNPYTPPETHQVTLAAAREMMTKAIQQASILSVPWQTIKGMVSAEAEAGELVMLDVPINPSDPDSPTESVVRSSIPGVKVFLKSGINRRKSS